jgi:hypothetical protein
LRDGVAASLLVAVEVFRVLVVDRPHKESVTDGLAAVRAHASADLLTLRNLP